MFGVVLDGALAGSFFRAIEDASEGLCEGYNWVAVEDAHGGALVSAKKFIRRFNKRWTRGDTLCWTWRCTWDFILRLTKNFKNIMKKKMGLTLQLMVCLTVQSRAHLKVHLKVPLKMQNILKGAFEITLKGTLEVSLESCNLEFTTRRFIEGWT